MMLRTKCQNCIFNIDYGCMANQSTEIIGEKQYTPGFCATKRSGMWHNTESSVDIKNALKKIKAEESSLTLLYVIKNNHTSIDLNSLVDIVNDNAGVITQLMFVVDYNVEATYLDAIYGIIHQFHCPVDITKILDDNIETCQLINGRIDSLSNHWYYVLLDDELPKIDNLRIFSNTVDTNAHTVAFYIDNDNIRGIYNKYVHLDMGGHISAQTLIEKIKTFENWKSVCKQLVS